MVQLIIKLLILASFNLNTANPRKEMYQIISSFFEMQSHQYKGSLFFCTEGIRLSAPLNDYKPYLTRDFLQREADNSFARLEIDSIFSGDDFLYMNSIYQDEANNVPKWSRKSLYKYKVPCKDSIDTQTPRFANSIYYRAALPLFSKDMSHALVYFESVCEGDCGEGNLYIYSKKSGAWKMLVSINLWRG